MTKNKRNIKLFNNNKAVSEVIGTILLLTISVSLFSVVYVSIFSMDVQNSTPPVNIVGTIQGNQLILEHRGGEPLPLNTGIIINYNGSSREDLKIDEGNFFNNDYKNNGYWDIGERFVFPLENLSNFSRFDPVSVTVVDEGSSSAVMMGTVTEARVADIVIEMSVTDDQPYVGDKIYITINVSNPIGPSEAKNVSIRYLLPYSLKHQNNITSQGFYNTETGIWDVGTIEVGSYATLVMKVKVVSLAYNPRTQFVLIMDGSGSISSDSWQLAIQGIANAVNNESAFPRDGSVELTIIQFAGTCIDPPEIGPIVVTQSNVVTIKNSILAINQDKGYTPMGAGIYLATDELLNTNNFGGFHKSYRQAIVVVTDGNPNVITQPNDLCGYYTSYNEGQQCANDARNYMIENLFMSEDQDEFNAIAVNPGSGHTPIDKDWLCDQIVWPQPCFDGTPPPEDDIGWPPAGPGWYRYADSWQEFESTISENFRVMFRKVSNYASVIETGYMDPNSNNNIVSISIYPQSP